MGRQLEVFGITGRIVLSATFPGHAFQFLFFLLRDVKTDDVHDKFNSRGFELFHQAAGIRVTGLFAIGHQDNGGFVLEMLDPFSSQSNRTADGRFPFWIELLYLGNHLLFVERSKGNELFHIVTISFAPMTIGHQTDNGIIRQSLDKIGEHLFGNNNFCRAFHLAPHGARGVKDKHEVAGGSALFRR